MPIPVPASSIIELKVVGEYNGAQETNNVFHYRENGTAQGTLDQYGIGLMNAIETNIYPILTNQARFIRIDCALVGTDGSNINGESVFFPSANDLGVAPGEGLPPYATWTFKYVRPSFSFRHGYKRFSGISETDQNSGFPASGVLTRLNTAAASLSAFIAAMTQDVDGNPDTVVTDTLAIPVVLQRIVNGDPINPINVANVSDVVFTKIGSQNSRKYGVGS